MSKDPAIKDPFARAPGPAPRVVETSARAAPGGLVGGRLWRGVLPEGLGLCLVAVILAGFASAYFLADYAWARTRPALRQSEAQRTARALAVVLGSTADDAGPRLEAALEALGRESGVKSVEWLGPDGRPRWTWPRSLPPALAGLRADGVETEVRAEAEVRGADGSGAGKVRVGMRAAEDEGYRSTLAWTWGAAAGLTLLVFGGVYQGLRRRVRAVAAV